MACGILGFLQQVVPAGLCMCYMRSAEPHLLNIASISNNLLLQMCMHGLHESICTLSPTQQRSKSLPKAKANTLTVQGSLYLIFKSSKGQCEHTVDRRDDFYRRRGSSRTYVHCTPRSVQGSSNLQECC